MIVNWKICKLFRVYNYWLYIMHGGESIQSALCPWMSRYCVLYDETRPHNSMKRRLGLLLDAINQIDNYPCKYEIFIG